MRYHKNKYTQRVLGDRLRFRKSINSAVSQQLFYLDLTKRQYDESIKTIHTGKPKKLF